MTVGVCNKHDGPMRYELIAEGACPTCHIPMDAVEGREDGPYGKCSCCGWCWKGDSEHAFVVLERAQGVNLDDVFADVLAGESGTCRRCGFSWPCPDAEHEGHDEVLG